MIFTDEKSSAFKVNGDGLFQGRLCGDRGCRCCTQLHLVVLSGCLSGTSDMEINQSQRYSYKQQNLFVCKIHSQAHHLFYKRINRFSIYALSICTSVHIK